MGVRVIAAAIRPPLRFVAQLERNTETGVSPTRQPLAPVFAVIDSALPCFYWEPESAVDTARAGLREGPNAVLVAIGPRLLVRRDADVQIGDRISSVRAGSTVVSVQTMRVVEVLFRQTHTDVGLELISSGPVVDAVLGS